MALSNILVHMLNQFKIWCTEAIKDYLYHMLYDLLYGTTVVGKYSFNVQFMIF